MDTDQDAIGQDGRSRLATPHARNAPLRARGFSAMKRPLERAERFMTDEPELARWDAEAG